MSGSLKFLQERIAKNEKFCMICLRREHETRLVQPKNLKNFISTVKKSSFALCYGEMACTLCENACRSALGLVNAFENTEKMYEILFQPDPPVMKKSKKKMHQDATDKIANGCIENLRQFREATTLKISETLLVSSDSPTECNFQSPPPTLSLPNSAAPVDAVITIIDDDETTEIEANTVDIEGDLFKVDNSTQTRPVAKRVLLKHQPLTSNVTQNQPAKVYKANTEMVTRNELAKVSNANATVNSESGYFILNVDEGNASSNERIKNLTLNVLAKPLNHALNAVPRLVSMEEFLKVDTKEKNGRSRNVACFCNDKKKLLVKLEDSCVVHDVIVYNDRILVPFMSCEIRNGRLLYIPNLFPEQNLSKICNANMAAIKQANEAASVKISGFAVENSKFIETTDGTTLDKALGEVLEDMQTLSRGVTFNGAADSTVSEDPLFVIENVKSEAVVELSDDEEPQPVRVTCSEPIQQKGRIDWEDKIPMDVISVVESDNTMLILPD